ncbi:uncharacterized protein PRCAT00001140001 [Priceomyces carsonii]|uniref:uncharacterized protein n=1 Tax=Priceomyces carsonii TaxID=28549 RepID=UPI002ED825D0|nr:unnamed protein product [Priceomyces carsonii]
MDGSSLESISKMLSGFQETEQLMMVLSQVSDSSSSPYERKRKCEDEGTEGSNMSKISKLPNQNLVSSIKKEGKAEEVMQTVIAYQTSLSQEDASQDISGSDNQEELQKQEKHEEKPRKQNMKEIQKTEKLRKKEEEQNKKQQEKKLREEERLRRQEQKIQEKRAKEDEKLKKVQEKERKRKEAEEEKTERERKREAERLRKEAEKLKKEKEKEEREKIRFEKKKRLEEDKQRREAEKEKKEEEKRRILEEKEKNQMKISSFFGVGQKIKSSPRTEANEDKCNAPEKTSVSVYNEYFLPFFVKKNVKMASSTQFSEQDLESSKLRFESLLKASENSKDLLSKFFHNHKIRRAETRYTSTERIINSLNSSSTTEFEVHNMCKHMPPIKYLYFYENSRPPYIGTWCSDKHLLTSVPIVDPFNTSTGLDYSYDSDIDWNGDEEGEGEDIDNEEEEDEDEDDEEELGYYVAGDDEMNDFVEKGNDQVSRKMIGPLVAVSEWNNNSHGIFDDMKYELISSNIKFAINPYHDYWLVSRKEHIMGTGTDNSLRVDPDKQNLINGNLKKIIEDKSTISDLIAFIEANNDFTIGTLVELSKKEFKSFTKSLLKQTIQDIASYNKKKYCWEVKPQVKLIYVSNES